MAGKLYKAFSPMRIFRISAIALLLSAVASTSIVSQGFAYDLPEYIPHPATVFGYDPFEITYVEPSEWPGSEATGHYYVDPTHPSATDTSNAYGYPNKPRTSFPTTISSGQSITLGGGIFSGTKSITATGTESAPCWIRVPNGRTATGSGRWDIEGSSHLIIDGVRFDNGSGNGRPSIKDGSSYITVKHCTIIGNGATNNGGSGAISADYVVWFANEASYIGNSEDMTTSDDRHALKPNGGAEHIWIVANHHHHNQGDSVQVGDPSQPADGNDPNYVYIVNNHFHDDRENAIDIKTARNVIIAGNTMYGYEKSASSSGEVVVIHDGCEDVWVLNNTIHNGRFGISTTGCTRINIAGNLVYNIWNENELSGGPFYDAGAALFFSNSTIGAVENNTIHNYKKTGIEITVGCQTNDAYIRNNIFSDRTEPTYWDIMFENSTDLSDSTLDYNIYPTNPRFRLSSSEYSSLANWKTSSGKDSNSLGATMNYTNEANGDFSLPYGSPAMDSGTPPAFLPIYNSKYSQQIDRDKAGTFWSSGLSQDIGAYEYGATGGATPPDAPSGLTANAVTSSRINLAWTDNSSDETLFGIERSTTSGSGFTEIVTVGAGVTAYSDEGLLAATTYYYRVRAYNAAGNSSYTVEASDTTNAAAQASGLGRRYPSRAAARMIGGGL